MSDNPGTPESIQMTRVFKAKASVHGLVFGVGIVSKVKNTDGVFEPFIDSQGDHITDEDMLAGVIKFMGGQRMMKAMHEGGPIGEVLLAWPLTEEVAKLYDLETKQTMWMVAVRLSDPADIARFQMGLIP